MATYRPAKNLSFLTWPQLELIDRLVGEMCQLSQAGEARLTVVFKNGKPRFIERSTSEELKPYR